jgi:hypothetical protein
MLRVKEIFEEDGGNDGQNVKFAIYWDPDDTSGKNQNGNLQLFFVDVDTAPSLQRGGSGNQPLPQKDWTGTSSWFHM